MRLPRSLRSLAMTEEGRGCGGNAAFGIRRWGFRWEQAPTLRRGEMTNSAFGIRHSGGVSPPAACGRQPPHQRGPGTQRNDKFGIRHSAFGIWHSAFGISAFGIRHLAFGIWHLAFIHGCGKYFILHIDKYSNNVYNHDMIRFYMLTNLATACIIEIVSWYLCVG